MQKPTGLQVTISCTLGLGLVLAACVIDRHESRKYGEAQRQQVHESLAKVSSRLEAELNERVHLAHGLEALALLRPHLTQGEFETFARGMDRQVNGIRALQLAHRGVVTHVHPESTNRAALGHALLEDPQTAPSARAARATGRMRVAGPYRLRQGNEGLVARLPVFHGTDGGAPEFWGFAIVVLDFPELLESVGLGGLTDITVGMRGRDGEGAFGAIFRGDESLFGPQAVTSEVFFPNGRWQLAAQPREGWHGSWPGRPWLFLVTALLLACVPPGMALHARVIGARNAIARLRLRERLLASLGEGVYGIGGDGRCTFINPAALQMLGWRREDVIGRDMRRVFHEGEALSAVLREGGGEGTMRRANGERFPARVTYAPFDYGEGGVVSFNDVTTQRANAERLRLAASVFTHTQQGIMITNAAGDLVDVNPAFTEITGYARDEVIGRNPRLLSSGRQPADFYARLRHSLETTGTWRGEIWNRHKSGQVYPELLHIAAVPGEDGRPRHFIGVFSDITRQKRHEAELTRLAHYDPLTGLPNRVLLADRLEHAIASVPAIDGRVALGILDIDRFKEVNDRLGHEVADEVLLEVARRLRLAMDNGDTVARLVGDEFAVLVSPAGGVEACEARAHRIVESLAIPIDVCGRRIELSASIGFTTFPDDSSNAEGLLRHAAQAMFVAKQEGGGRYRLFDPEQDRLARVRRATLDQVARAIERGELRLYYQPKIDMRDKRVLGFEALVRWEHPERGLLEPAAFLPVIAGTDLDAELGRWVMSRAAEQLEDWRQQGMTLSVSVNVSASHLLAKGFLSELDAVLAAHPGVAPSCLEIEVLETVPFDDLGAATALLRGCLDRGLGVAIDDFGTGYSSLAYFKHLPARALKIDQIFIRDLLRDDGDRAIVEGIIRFARAFGLNVVAEGVESMEVFDALVAMGCHAGQGFAIAAPMPADRVPNWLRDYRMPDPITPPVGTGR